MGKTNPPGPGRNPVVDFHGEKRTNETHVSPKDPKAKLYREAVKLPAKLYYIGHVLMEHRNGLIVDVELTEANGYAERRWRCWTAMPARVDVPRRRTGATIRQTLWPTVASAAPPRMWR